MAFSFAPQLRPSAPTGSADDLDYAQVTHSVELEPWPAKQPRHSEDADLASPSSSSSSSSSASTPDSGSFADRLANLPSYQPRQRFPTPSIRSSLRRTDSISSSSASSIISTPGSDAVIPCSRRAQRRASEDAWRQFWD